MMRKFKSYIITSFFGDNDPKLCAILSIGTFALLLIALVLSLLFIPVESPCFTPLVGTLFVGVPVIT